MQRAADCLERLGIQYRIVGSMASMAYGEARFTNDIDILADLREENLDQIVPEFPAPDYYLSIDAARTAIREQRQFNIIHAPSGLKLDIIQRKNSEFGALDITLGKKLKSEGFYDAWFASPENVILMKLRYYHEGASDKHLRDIASILLVQGTLIDGDYLDLWSKKLGVESEWKLVRDRLAQLGEPPQAI